ncbi:unnamed protein product, partial [Effrenium voratum]
MQSCLTFKSAGLMALRRLCLARPQFQALRAARFQVRPRADGEPHLDIGSRFGQVLKAEQEGDMKEMVASAKEVIQLGKALLDRSSDQSTGSLEQADVRQKMGLAHFKLGHVHDKHEHLGEEGHFQKGLEYLKEAAQERGNLQDWFNLMSIAACAGDAIQSQAAFEQLEGLFAKSEEEFLPWPQVLQYHVCALRDGQCYGAAFGQVERMRQIYQQLGITDTHFLYIRGVPFFSTFLELAETVIKPLPDVEWNAWLDELAKHVDDEGKQSIEEEAEKSPGRSSLGRGPILELGMGTGKVAMQLFLSTGRDVFGVELAPSRAALGFEALKRLQQAAPRFQAEVESPGDSSSDSSARLWDAVAEASLEFSCGSLLDTAPERLQGATAVVLEVCLPLELQKAACQLLQALPVGCPVVSYSALGGLVPQCRLRPRHGGIHLAASWRPDGHLFAFYTADSTGGLGAEESDGLESLKGLGCPSRARRLRYTDDVLPDPQSSYPWERGDRVLVGYSWLP